MNEHRRNKGSLVSQWIAARVKPADTVWIDGRGTLAAFEARRGESFADVKIREESVMKKKVKAKIIFAVCLVLFAAALIAALIVINKSNENQNNNDETNNSVSLGDGIELPRIPVQVS